MGGGTLWKEGNTDLFTPVLRKNGLSPRLRLFTAVSGKAQGLFCGPSEAEEQLNRAGLGWEGVRVLPRVSLFLGPSNKGKETGRGKRKELSRLAKWTGSGDSGQ